MSEPVGVGFCCDAIQSTRISPDIWREAGRYIVDETSNPCYRRSRYLTVLGAPTIVSCMRSTDEHHKGLESTSYRELRLLEEVEGTPNLSQRKLAHHLGIALGVANILVRNHAKRGYIRITRLGWRRWAYVLTPAGMARKISLTFAYIEGFVDHYSRVRSLLRDDLSGLTLSSESRVAILGTSELAELAYLALRDLGISDIDVFDRDSSGAKFLGNLVPGLEAMVPEQYAKVVIADSGDTEDLRDELVARGVGGSQIVELLRAGKRQLGKQRHTEAPS